MRPGLAPAGTVLAAALKAMQTHASPTLFPPPAAGAETPVLQRLRPRKVALFRALQLGDMLCAVPAMRALRRALPHAHITLIGLPWAQDFARRFSAYVDDFLPFPGLAGLPEREPDPQAWPAFLDAVRARCFDLAVQMHGDGSRTNAVVRALEARATCGFSPQAPGPNHLPYPNDGPEALRLLALAGFLGAPVDDLRMEFPLLEGDAQAWGGYAEVEPLLNDGDGRYVCIHPGARDPRRRWPTQHFAAVADAIVDATGLQVVISGSGEEAGLAREVAQQMRHRPIEAAAPVPVGALAALLRGARLLVSNDTGPSHIAAGLGVPSVIVFRASDMARWAPLDRERHCPVWDPEGRRVDEVRALALRQLGHG
jgi:ADP-heptose:LPS heptosyltransferase